MVHLVRNQNIKRDKLELAKQFRKEATLSENIVWQLIRNRKIHNLKWRRQQIIEGFVADFYCSDLNVVLEIDGEVHDNDSAREYDQLRTEIFESLGITTYRLKNEDCDEEHITKLITDIINSLPLHTGEGWGEVSLPLHTGEGRGEVGFPLHTGEGRGEVSLPLHTGEGRGEVGFPLHTGEGRSEVRGS